MIAVDMCKIKLLNILKQEYPKDSWSRKPIN